MDKYQERYINHQAMKKKTMTELIKLRHSDRMFGDGKIPIEEIKEITDAANMSPSSCNRKAIDINIVDDRDDKAFLGGLLVGGVGWVHRASHILLFVSNDEAYKENLPYMKFLDCGFMAQNVYLAATDLGLSCCFVNPNIRIKAIPLFESYFDINITENQTFLGAMAIGDKV